MINSKTYFCVLLCLFAATNLCAQTPQSKTEPVHSELLRMILPDLQFDPGDPKSATAHRTIPLRHIGEKETESLEGNFSITDFRARRIMNDGREVLLMHLDLSAEGLNEGTPYEGEASLLAAFSLEPKPKLLDVMDIKTDRFTDFWEGQPVFKLNSQNDAFVLHNSHFNAGENYNDLQLLFLDGEQFKVITSLFLLNTQGCAATINQTPSFRAVPDAGKYPKIIVKVELKKEADTKECTRKTPAYTKYYQAVFYWNRAKGEYQGNARQLNALDKFNRGRL